MSAKSFAEAIGSIPGPEEPALQQLAERAGLLCFFRFPYFPLRFGARGQAFAIHDAGYLVRLRTAGADETIRQVHWLAGLLACRGMPSWLLEVQLQYVIRLLRPRGEPIDALLRAHASLVGRRCSIMTHERMQACGASFAQAVGLPPFRRVRETGMLLASAWCDERNGLSSPEPFLSWMTDSARFPPRWTVAVQNTYQSLGGDPS